MSRPTAVFWAVAVAAVLLSLLVVTPAISLDDPFIGLRYARNLVDGHGLVYNPGEPPVEGYTAWLWVMVAALGIALGFEPLAFWQFLGLGIVVATLWLTYRFGWRSDRPKSRALLAPALLAVHVSFVAYPMTGMETSFYTLVVTLAALLVAENRHRATAGALALGGVLLLICLTRFDGLGLAALALAWVLLVDRQGRSFLLALAPLLVGLALYNGWRLAFYGDPLPNTFYAKTRSLGEQLRAGASYLLRFAARGGPFVLLLAAPFVLRGRAGRHVRVAAWMALGQLAYVLVVGGDWMPYYRFVLPVLPLLCYLLQETFWEAVEWLGRVGGEAVRRAGARAGVALLLIYGLVPLVASSYVNPPPQGPYWNAEEAREVGRAVSEMLPADALVAVEWAGILPFYLRQPVLDIFGLSDREITGSDLPGSTMGRALTPEILVERAPQLVVYSARILPTAGAAAAVGPEIRGEGQWITGFYSSLLRPEHGYVRCVVRLDEGRYWPVLARRDIAEQPGLCVA